MDGWMPVGAPPMLISVQVEHMTRGLSIKWGEEAFTKTKGKREGEIKENRRTKIGGDSTGEEECRKGSWKKNQLPKGDIYVISDRQRYPCPARFFHLKKIESEQGCGPAWAEVL